MSSRLLMSSALAALVFLGGCATTAGPVSPREAAPYSDREAEPRPLDEIPEESGDDAPQEDSVRSVKPGTGVFINQDLASRSPPGPGPTGEVTFNFEGESLHAVVKAILGDFLEQNYVVAPGVQGTVTFSTAKPLRGDQALSILEMLLRWNNATMVWQDGRYTILPVAQAVAGNLTPRFGAVQNARGYEVRAIPLQFISAVEMEKLLKPYAKPEALVSVDPQRNMLVLAGTRAELENYLQTIAVFDVDWLSGMSVGVFPLSQAEAAKTVTELEKIFGEGSNTPLAGMFRFMPLEGINAVLVITSQPNYLGQIEEWLERLDLGGGEAGQRLYLYDVKNVKAVDLANTLSDIFGGGGGSRPATQPSDNLMPGLEPVQIRTVGTSGNVSPSAANGGEPERSASRSSGGGGGDKGGAGTPGGRAVDGPVVDSSGGIALGASEEVRISASEENNALLVKATPSQWESIRRVIERLDTIPLQVQIEAQIVRVALNKSLSFGVQWFFENGITDGGTGVAPLRAVAQNRTSWSGFGGGVNPTGVNWTFIGPDSVALISALDTVSDVTVMSAPSLVVLNNKTANINVGTQLPVVSSFINNNIGTGTGNGLNQSYVQFRQTGITLSVTPRVNPGGLVFMEVEQEESEPGSGDPVGGNVPVDNRSISTEIAVQSGQTVVLGGLIKETSNTSKGGLPFINRIPVLGSLFGRQSSGTIREELLVMITPRVIRSEDEAAKITEEYSRRFRGLQPLRVRLERELNYGSEGE